MPSVSVNWEQAIIAVVQRELAQLEWLINSEQSKTEGIERGDIHSQISRLSGLTDLAQPDGLPVSETTGAKLRQLNDVAMRMVQMWTCN